MAVWEFPFVMDLMCTNLMSAPFVWRDSHHVMLTWREPLVIAIRQLLTETMSKTTTNVFQTLILPTILSPFRCFNLFNYVIIRCGNEYHLSVSPFMSMLLIAVSMFNRHGYNYGQIFLPG